MQSRNRLIETMTDGDYELERVLNEHVDGYRLNNAYLRRGDRDFVSFEAIDQEHRVCYNFSFAVRDFTTTESTQIKLMLAPLTSLIEGLPSAQKLSRLRN